MYGRGSGIFYERSTGLRWKVCKMRGSPIFAECGALRFIAKYSFNAGRKGLTTRTSIVLVRVPYLHVQRSIKGPHSANRGEVLILQKLSCAPYSANRGEILIL